MSSWLIYGARPGTDVASPRLLLVFVCDPGSAVREATQSKPGESASKLRASPQGAAQQPAARHEKRPGQTGLHWLQASGLCQDRSVRRQRVRGGQKRKSGPEDYAGTLFCLVRPCPFGGGYRRRNMRSSLGWCPAWGPVSSRLMLCESGADSWMADLQRRSTGELWLSARLARIYFEGLASQ